MSGDFDFTNTNNQQKFRLLWGIIWVADRFLIFTWVSEIYEVLKPMCTRSSGNALFHKILRYKNKIFNFYTALLFCYLMAFE